MLVADNRLKSKKEFNDIFRRGKVVLNDVLLARYQPDASGALKIGFSVGVKFSKKATERNKVKRWMREAVRPMIGKIRKGHKIIFLINSKFPYGQMNFILVKKKVEDLLWKAKLFRQ